MYHDWYSTAQHIGQYIGENVPMRVYHVRSNTFQGASDPYEHSWVETRTFAQVPHGDSVVSESLLLISHRRVIETDPADLELFPVEALHQVNGHLLRPTGAEVGQDVQNSC